jgi:hypothetical protein
MCHDLGATCLVRFQLCQHHFRELDDFVTLGDRGGDYVAVYYSLDHRFGHWVLFELVSRIAIAFSIKFSLRSGMAFLSSSGAGSNVTAPESHFAVSAPVGFVTGPPEGLLTRT